MLQPSPREQTSTHTLCKTLDVKDHKNEVQPVPGMFSGTLGQAMESIHYFVGIPSAVFSHSHHATLSSFFSLNLSQSQTPAGTHGFPCTVIRCALCLTGMQILCTFVTHYGSRIMVYYCLTIESGMATGIRTMSRQKTEEKAYSYFTPCNFQDLCISRKQSSMQIQS